jgi:UDP-N-acetylglucosamine--N-acetylmuramyl-(pentapeptide) pyrophosphoryl-undecaprenol N-acetylglucosamine transferase
VRVLLAGGGTGGHLMRALALADALVELDRSVEPVVIGARRGVEASILPQRSYRYHLLPLEPIHRRAWWRNFKWPALVWRLARECNRLLREERPVLVVGTGGYVSGPVLFQASRRGVPIALQEQNAYPGMTTRLLARRASQIHLGFPEARAHLKPGPITAVHPSGNPIARPPETGDRAAARDQLSIPRQAKVLFVMGGSQGASAVNSAVKTLVDEGCFDQTVLLWSTGRTTWREYAGYHRPPHRFVRDFWDPIAAGYAVSDVVVARAGAMTTAELCAWGLPAIYVPLPGAAADHQTKNAKALAQAGAAIVLEQSQLTPQSLRAVIFGLLEDPGRTAQMRGAARARGKPEAARNIASHLLTIVS